MASFPLRFIVGLGNPGPEYALTRHNAGFWFVDALARVHGGHFRDQRKYGGELARIRIGDHELELFKPMTYMNRSGLAIRSVAEYFRIPLEQTLIAHDELDLPVGTVRLKSGGGAGGHNGLRDTIAHLGDAFWRLRFGVGHPGNKDEVTDYVLRRAPREEEEQIIECVGQAVEMFPKLLADGPEKTMNALHRKKDDTGGAKQKQADGED
jgi:peptidyl-tRNA hydrolase, PTH1 family